MTDELIAVLIEFEPGMSLEEVQAEYQDRLYVLMQDYLQGDRPITSYRNEFHRIVNDGFTFAFIAGESCRYASAAMTW